MIPANAVVALSSAGVFLDDKHAWYGRDCYFRGGVGPGDGSRGIDYQTWKAHIVGRDTVRVEPVLGGTPIDTTIVKVEACSAAWDRGMNLDLAFVQDGRCFLHWFDTVINAYTLSEFVGARNIICVYDDVRDSSVDVSDVLVTYQRGRAVYWRQQRDRFLIEYTASAAANGELLGFGMGTQWRMLWNTAPTP